MLHNSEKDFIKRHIGPSKKDEKNMLEELGYQSLSELIKQTVPDKILFKGELNIGESNSEYEALRKLKAISKQNKIYSNFIGMGYYGTYTPNVIIRNILEKQSLLIHSLTLHGISWDFVQQTKKTMDLILKRLIIGCRLINI